MKVSLLSRCSIGLLASVSLSFSASASEGGTLTAPPIYTGTSGGTFQFSNGEPAGEYVIFSALDSSTTTVNLTGKPSIIKAKEPKFPALSGKAGDLKITKSGDGNILKVKTKVAITNSGTGAAKNVTATVYLSDDAVLDTDEDTKLTTLKLSDYVPEATKLRKGQTLSLPIKRKVPVAATAFLKGKYLIAVLTADAPKGTVTAAFASVVANSASGGEYSLVLDGTTPTFVFVPASTSGQFTAVDLVSTMKLSDIVFTAEKESTFSVSRPVNKKFSTDAIVPTATFKVAAIGETFNLLSGEEAYAQAGDELQILPGTFLHSGTNGLWNGRSVKLDLGEETSTAADMLVCSGQTITARPPNAAVVTPASQVIIGPIHLPQN